MLEQLRPIIFVIVGRKSKAVRMPTFQRCSMIAGAVTPGTTGSLTSLENNSNGFPCLYRREVAADFRDQKPAYSDQCLQTVKGCREYSLQFPVSRKAKKRAHLFLLAFGLSSSVKVLISSDSSSSIKGLRAKEHHHHKANSKPTANQKPTK